MNLRSASFGTTSMFKSFAFPRSVKGMKIRVYIMSYPIMANFLCVKHLSGECAFNPCKNIHDITSEAREEYAKKGINRICNRFNNPTDPCPYVNCKFLHISINSPQKVDKNSKVNAALSGLKINLLRLEDLIENLNLLSETASAEVFPVPDSILAFHANVYDTLKKLNSTLETNLTKIRLN